MAPGNPETNVPTPALSPGSGVQLLPHFDVPGWWHMQAEWMPWIWRRTQRRTCRRSRAVRLSDDVGNIIGVTEKGGMPCYQGRRERNKKEEYMNFQLNRLCLIQGISGKLSLDL